MRASGQELVASADILQRTKTEEFHSLGLSLGYTYAGSSVIAGAVAPGPIDVTSYVPSTQPGGRLPHVWLAPGSALYDRLGRGMTLLHPAATVDPERIARLQESARARHVPLTVVARDDGGAGAGDVLLVRPDQHIAWRGTDPGELDLDLVTGHVRSRAPVG